MSSVYDDIDDEFIPPRHRRLRDEQRAKATMTPEVPSVTGNLLYDLYGIKPGTPRIQTVETLLLGSVEVEDIAELMKMPPSEAEELATRISDTWKKIGTAPTPEERQLQRGQMIVRLQRYQRDISRMDGEAIDPRSFTVKLQIEDRLSNLQRLQVGKDEGGEDADEVDEIDKWVSGLSTEEMTALMAVLKPDVHSPAPVPKPHVSMDDSL